MRALPLALSSAALLAFAVLIAPGCTSAVGDACQSAVNCEGGNDDDVQACIGEADGAAEVASAYNCDDAYSKLVDCLTSSGHCDKGNWKTNCDKQDESVGACEQAAMGHRR
ncbi:MAG TPA: hypothetical protein VGM56_25960 [Byssovorax sp.]|jgi:hypothetical protein